MRSATALALLLSASFAMGEGGSRDPVLERWSLVDAVNQQDFPDLALDASGVAWVAYIEHDGKTDLLQLARRGDKGLEDVAAVSTPGVLHQPAVAVDGAGAVWTFWGQLGPNKVMILWGRRYAGGKLAEPIKIAESKASETFADAGTDAAGRFWVAWQSMRNGQADIYVRHLDARSGTWSKEIPVAAHPDGDWEPRLAFDGRDGAWVAFDSARGDEFNIYLARVELDGRVELRTVTSSPAYEGRVSVASSPDYKSLWIACERGRQGWGKDLRTHGAAEGLNGQKKFVLIHYDIASGKAVETPGATPILARWVADQWKKKPAPPAGQPPRPAGVVRTMAAVNLPEVALDAAGNPWVACRYFTDRMWHMAYLRYDAARKTWSEPVALEESTFGQDRRCEIARDAEGKLLLCWASDRRADKKCGVAGIYLARIDTGKAPPDAAPVEILQTGPPPPYFNAPTPERPRGDRHFWNLGEKKWGLYWADFHRHTDVSNCITGNDGCIVEQFRYAYDMTKLDILGTSDHTDVGKPYHPYEWWHNQRLVDVFYSPGVLTSMYAYEREQPWPYGHRNVVFADRGGPVVHINRKLYQESPWQALYPVGDGGPNILPEELWKILRAWGKPVTDLTHTGATGMGTDWNIFKEIDGAVENLVEIYQGARVSYEGLGAPQPTVGHLKDQKYNTGNRQQPNLPDLGEPIKSFGQTIPNGVYQSYDNGVYQNALRLGHRLGVFASSDHISQNTSFGGVYTDDFTREGIIAAMNARRTIAATDKIYLEFSCNGKPLGSIFETDRKPELRIAVRGTAAMKRVTLIRNEADHKVFEGGGRDFAADFTDPEPVAGENRYYVRVEQVDGNMAWASPVWVTFRKP